MDDQAALRVARDAETSGCIGVVVRHRKVGNLLKYRDLSTESSPTSISQGADNLNRRCCCRAEQTEKTKCASGQMMKFLVLLGWSETQENQGRLKIPLPPIKKCVAQGVECLFVAFGSPPPGGSGRISMSVTPLGASALYTNAAAPVAAPNIAA